MRSNCIRVASKRARLSFTAALLSLLLDTHLNLTNEPNSERREDNLLTEKDATKRVARKKASG